MTPERWERVKHLYDGARARQPAERSAFLAQACVEDDELRREVQALLDQPVATEDFVNFVGGPAPGPALAAQLGASHGAPSLTGRRLGVYQVQALLGRGGMGDVYRAHDTRLGRDVAIKFLPPAFTSDPDRLARFEREARMVAALNHPHIAALYGVEESGGVRGLVLELVEGETLAERIRKPQGLRLPADGGGASSGLPLGEALGYARQIAEALEAAHEKGITHRDLKPANIKLTPDGVVKLLDFGIAKVATGDGPGIDLTQAKTATLDATMEGVIVGTAGYMSPEQARGKPVDKRADIWAFGCVLYEMLSGRMAFEGETLSDTIAAILDRTPDWATLPAATPTAVRRLLQRCLDKDPKQRLRDIGEARIELMGDFKVELDEIRDDVGSRRLRTPAARFSMWAAAAVALAAAGVMVWTQRQAAPTSISTGTLTRLTSDSGLAIAPALSPDGRLVAYASDRAGEGNLDIWVQQVAGGEPIRLTRHAADEFDPTFSPDGTQIAFRSDRDGGGVYVVSALGGEPVLLAPNGHGPRFSPDGQWLAYHTGIPDAFFPGGSLTFASAKVYVVRPTGGPPMQIQPAARSAAVRAWSPDSQHLLILGSFGGSPQEWWVTPLDGAASRIDVGLLGQQGLLGGPKPGSYPVAWLPGNRIVFSAQSGDSRNYWTATLSSSNWQIEQPLQRLTFGAGLEGYGSAVATAGDMRLVFSSIVQNVDLWSVPLGRTGLQASGPPLQLTQDAALDREPTLTPDGTTLVWNSDRQRRPDLWTRDLVTGRETNLLSMPPFWLGKPVISPDGSKLAFFRMQSGFRPPSATLITELSSNPDGTLRAAQPMELPKVAEVGSGYPWSWSPDGQRLWYDPILWPRLAPNHLYDIATRKILAQFGHPQHDLYDLNLSPDGRWLAFLEPLSDNTGRLVVAPIVGGIEPAGPSEWIPITSGDHSPNWGAWSPAGDVLYYESNSDGYVCVWAQRLARDTMRPVGSPVAIHHAHSARLSIGRIGPNERGLAAARDKVIFNMLEMNSNIWMTEFADGGRGPREGAGR